MSDSKRQVPGQNHRSASLSDFEPDLEKALSPIVNDPQVVSEIVEKVWVWTKGEPFLTGLISDRLLKYSQTMGDDIQATIVDGIVEVKIIQNWEENAAGEHLKAVCRPVIAYEPRDSLLILYIQILQRGAAPARQSPEQAALLASGLVMLEGNQLVMTNAIYAKVFDLAWVETLLPGLTRPVAIVKAPLKSQPPSRQISPIVLGTAGGLALLLLSTIVYLQVFEKQRGASERASERANERASEKAALAVEGDATLSSEIGAQMTPLVLLGDTFSGYSTFRDASFQTALKKTGIAVKYSNEFDQTLRAQKLNQDEADLMVTTLDQYLQQQPKGKIVGLLDRTVGAHAVVLNTPRYPELKSLLDLTALVKKAKDQGKTVGIAYAADTPSEYLAMVLDDQFDTFDLSDFELKPAADASEAWTLMQNPTANVAIAILWEPYVAQAQQKGYSVALSSDDVPNTIVDVIVASDKLISSNPALLARFLENYYRRIDANARDATQLQTQVAEDGNLSMGDAIAIINGIDFFTAVEAESWMNDGLLAERINATAAILARVNQLDPDRLNQISAEASTLYASQFIAEAANNTQTIIDLMKVDNPSLANKLEGNTNTITIPKISSAQIQQAADIGNVQVRGKVDFTTGAAELTAEGKQTLDQLASELKEFNGQRVAVRVIGHTSRVGDAALNQSLSEARASVVVSYLKGLGVALNILPEGKGSSEPLPNVNPMNAQNQRTEIRLVRVE
ncbi:MAG: OmpA family protein [Phormidesmis sp.]